MLRQNIKPSISRQWLKVAGQVFVNLTEPQAGTDLAAIRSMAIPEGDHYRTWPEDLYHLW